MPQVLAEADDVQQHPLLIAGQSGDGRVLAFAGDSTWHWQMQGFGDAHRRFWRQCVLWLAKKDLQTEGRVWIRLAGRRVCAGHARRFRRGCRQCSRRADRCHSLRRRRAERPMAARSTLDRRRTASNDSPRFARPTSRATTESKSQPAMASKELGTAEARFLVPNQDLELDRPAAEPSLMAQLAEMTSSAGGKALAPEELPTLIKHFADEPPKLQEEIVAKVTYWDKWPFFLLFVALLGVEWYLRKRWGLV